MKQRLLISVAAAALIAGSGLAYAQDTGGSPSGGAASGPGSSATPHSSTSPSQRSGTSAGPMNRDDPSGMRGAESGRGSDSGMRSSQSEPKAGERNQRAQDSTTGQKSNMSQENSKDGSKDASKAGQDMKAEDRSTTTTGQAGAGGKLSSDQRSKITTVIKRQRVEPATNINFSISIGTRVPREVRFHPLPAEIVTVYPDWRGYEFFLVRDEIVVVNPRTMEIVAVLDA
uniref:DUF1236 domain-containing protein n=1 Tax=Rhodopseudomonas palustris (strain BisA53) TaxID=316055 RepID=Q07MB2_RHOP5